VKQWLIDNATTILTALFGGGSFWAFLQERRKRQIEERQMGADALSRMQEAYDRFTADSLEQYNSLKREVEELKKKLGDMRQSMEKERNKYLALKRDYEALKISYAGLKKEFDQYKTNHNDKAASDNHADTAGL